MKPRSLRRDLALGLGAGLLALWLVALTGAWVVLTGEIGEIYDAGLSRTAQEIAAALGPAEGPARAARGEDGMISILRDAGGGIRALSPGAEPSVFGDAPRTGYRDGADHRIFGLLLADGSVLEVADPLDERREAAREALAAFLIAAAILLPLSLAGIAWFTRARLRPVAALARQVSLRDAADLAPIGVPDLQREIVPILDAVNGLMRQLSQALAAERAFSANAAHEMRTPIAAALAQTQRLIAEAPEGPLRRRADAIEAELKRIARLSEKLLDLARAEGAGASRGAVHDMRPIVAFVVGEVRSAAPVALSLPPDPVLTAMDPDALGILARNLIDNALRHGRPPIAVELSGDARLMVVNGGPVLPPESLARLPGRFERLDDRKDGVGLGLAIVDALLRNVGGRLELLSPAPGRTDGFAAIALLRPEGSADKRQG